MAASISDFAFRIRSNLDSSMSTPFDGVYLPSHPSVYSKWNSSSTSSSTSSSLHLVRSSPSQWVISNSTTGLPALALVNISEPFASQGSIQYPPPFHWGSFAKCLLVSPCPIISLESIVPFVLMTPAVQDKPSSIRVLVPCEGDSFLKGDNVLNISWASCILGVYPHRVHVDLYQNGNFLARLASDLEDTGLCESFFIPCYLSLLFSLSVIESGNLTFTIPSPDGHNLRRYDICSVTPVAPDPSVLYLTNCSGVANMTKVKTNTTADGLNLIRYICSNGAPLVCPLYSILYDVFDSTWSGNISGNLIWRYDVSRGRYFGANFTIQVTSVSTVLKGVSGSFTLQPPVNLLSQSVQPFRTSSRSLDVLRFSTDLPIVYSSSLSYYPFNMNIMSYRMQSLYRAAWLTEAGFGKNERISALQFTMGISVFKAVQQFRLAIGFTSSSAVLIPPVFWPTSVVYGPEDITTDQMAEGMTLTFPCNVTWDGVSNMVIELSYMNFLVGMW